MKKLLTIVLAVILTASTAMAVFAAPGLFINSPSENPVPQLVEYSNESHDCFAKLVITAYIKRDTLPDDKRALIEKAYDEIVKSKDLSELTSDIKAYAEKAGVPVSALAVSDLFDVSYYACELHNEHGKFFITLKADTLKNFVGLMHLSENGWVMVDDAKVDSKEETLTFSADDLSPFAVVVKTQGSSVPTGDNSANWIYFVIMMISATALIVIAVAQKKKNARKTFVE